MKIRSNYKGVKGFVTLYNDAIRYRDMITEEAIRRLKILIHWEKHGIASTVDAFSTSRRTLFNWKKSLTTGKGKTESLNPKKREPKQKRKRLWNVKILEEIQMLREKHPNLGKEKLYPLLLDFCDAFGITKCPKTEKVEPLPF